MIFLIEFFSMNFLSFVTVFRLWAEHTSTMAQKLWKSCRRRLLLEQQVFWGKFVSWRKYLPLQIFPVLMKNSADFCRKVFRLIWKTAFYTRSGDLRAEHYHFPRENIRLLTDFEGKCLEFCKVILTWWSKLFFLCPEDIFEEILSFFTKCSKFSVVLRLSGNHFGILAKNNLVGLSKLFSRVQGIFLEKFYFENKFLEIFLYFWSSRTNFLDFRRKFCDRSVKTAFYVSSGDFWLDCFSNETFRFFHRLRALRKKVWQLGAKASKSLSKLQFMCTK